MGVWNLSSVKQGIPKLNYVWLFGQILGSGLGREFLFGDNLEDMTFSIMNDDSLDRKSVPDQLKKKKRNLGNPDNP